MSKTVEFYYDYGSPASYLAWTQMPDLCKRHGATLVYKPILICGVFKLTGNVSPVTVAPKGAWFFDDAKRHAAHYGVPFQKNPFFIINSLPLMRGAIWAAREGRLEDFNRVMFEACWVTGRNLNDPDEIKATVRKGGFDPEALGAAIQTDEIKQTLIKATEEAVDRGIFGVPTTFVAGEMHFGQDRLQWVERALAA
ncbi:MAG: 2-hydroxychromene-2-carboxylate isomerase [Geminicoccaceae bacterium]